MNEPGQPPAKALTPEEQSDGIVVSFSEEWHKPLLNKAFSAVIRKRVPKTIKSRWLYFHINSPICAICGRAEILRVEEISLERAKTFANRLDLAPAEIERYFAGDKSVGCYSLGKISIAKSPLSKEALSEHLVYHPPQSFIILSQHAKKVIDTLARFSS